MEERKNEIMEGRKDGREKERKEGSKKDSMNVSAVPVAPSPPGDISVTHPA